MKTTLLRMTIMWQMLLPFVSRLSGSAPLKNWNDEKIEAETLSGIAIDNHKHIDTLPLIKYYKSWARDTLIEID